MILQFLVITHRVRDIVVRLFRTVLVKDGVHDLTIRLTVGGEGIAHRPIHLVDIFSQGMHTADLLQSKWYARYRGIPIYGYPCRNNSSFLPLCQSGNATLAEKVAKLIFTAIPLE